MISRYSEQKRTTGIIREFPTFFTTVFLAFAQVMPPLVLFSFWQHNNSERAGEILDIFNAGYIPYVVACVILWPVVYYTTHNRQKEEKRLGIASAMFIAGVVFNLLNLYFWAFIGAGLNQN